MPNGDTGPAPDLAKIPVSGFEEFRAAARRPLEVRMRYAFIEDVQAGAPRRCFFIVSFDTMEDYRRWCEARPPGLVRLWPRLNIDRLRRSETVFSRHGCRYLFIGKSGAISVRGSPTPLQDADLYVQNVRPPTGQAIVLALGRALGFTLSAVSGLLEIIRGKDFVQLKNWPVRPGSRFAPDGIEQFDDAWRRHVEVDGFPVCRPDDIIASKVASNRQKDRESLPRLKSFRENWLTPRQPDRM